MVMSLICSWVCSVSFLFSSLYWKNDYVEWHIWFSVIFCAIYFSMTCAVCVYQAISQNKVRHFTSLQHENCLSSVYRAYTLCSGALK